MQPTDKHTIKLKSSIDNIHPLGNEYYSKEGQLTGNLGFISNGVLRIFYLNEKGEEWNRITPTQLSRLRKKI